MHFVALLSFLAAVSARPVSRAGPTMMPRDAAYTPIPAPTGRIASTWWTDYHNANISTDKYNHLMYAFAIPKSPSELTMESSTDTLIKNFVDTAHAKKIPVSLTVGGWGASGGFSTVMKSADSRSTFVKTLIDLVSKHQFDGVDFDWEYPNDDQGTAQDSDNFLAFLQELRKDALGSKLILSAATAINPWNDANKKPLTDVSGFAKVFDFIHIMNYDIWGPWSAKIGPNAPLDDSCASDKAGSATGAVAVWTAAGMPANKIVMGVASYGHSYTFSGDKFTPYAPLTDKTAPKSDKWNPEGTSMEFFGMVDTGLLGSDGKPKDGVQYTWDDCSKTAYVYDPNQKIVVSYDDVRAFQEKGSFIKSKNLRGFGMWEAGGDYKDMLLDAILKAQQ